LTSHPRPTKYEPMTALAFFIGFMAGVCATRLFELW
jgi:hypothetical protein